MSVRSGTLQPEGVQSMFDRIAPIYDVMNRLMTAGLDRRWRAITARAVPLLGRVLPGGAAYTYLPASVRRFPGPEALADQLRAAGFDDVGYRLFAGGIVALHTGRAVA